MPGYLQAVVGHQDSALMCGECNLLLRDPQLALCGHRHCFSCKAPKCTRCFQDKTDSIADGRLKLTIEDMWATCPDCKFAGNIAQYNQHTCSKLYAKNCAIKTPPTELESLKQQLTMTNELVKALQKQIQKPPANFQGKLIWKISNYSKLSEKPIVSEPFYTGHYGYKMCASIYPKGDGVYKNTHLSVFVALMPHEWDSILPWPFNMSVTLVIVDQKRRKDIISTFRPDCASASFQKPAANRGANVASGNPFLCRLTDLGPGSDYVIDDTLFVKVVVF